MDAGLQEDLLPEVVTVLLVGIKMSLKGEAANANLNTLGKTASAFFSASNIPTRVTYNSIPSIPRTYRAGSLVMQITGG